MSEILKGNYRLRDDQQVHATTGEKSLTDAFEEATMAKVGGSICFVMKSDTFVWDGDESEAG